MVRACCSYTVATDNLYPLANQERLVSRNRACTLAASLLLSDWV